MTQAKMKAAFYIFVVSCWTISQAMAAALSNNYQPQIGKKYSSKAGGTLPILHVVFDVASGANAQSLSGANRRLLNVLLSQNVAQNFAIETMMSISTFTGSDSGKGSYLKVLSPPVNVVQNFQALSDIIQFNVTGSVTNDANRDPGAAIRDALIKFSNQLNPDAADILYLVSRRYVDGGPTVKVEELDVIGTILAGSLTLICVEGANVNDPNRLLNLKRVAELTEGYYFTNTDTQTNSWANKNDAAINLMLSLAKSPINFVRRKVDRREFFEVSDVSKSGSFVVTPDLGTNSVITIQSTQKGIVTVALTNIQTGATVTLKTKGVPNWNMTNANLYVDDLALSSAGGETRGRWNYALTFDAATNALDTESDVVILGLSSINANPLSNQPGVWASSCNLSFPDQQSTSINAEVYTPAGPLTGLAVTVTLTNVGDINSQDITIKLTEEVQGKGLYSGMFKPPSNGLYVFSAKLEADIDPFCTGGLCAASDYSDSARGQCQIVVQGKVIETTTIDINTSTTDTTTTTSDTTTIATDTTTIATDTTTIATDTTDAATDTTKIATDTTDAATDTTDAATDTTTIATDTTDAATDTTDAATDTTDAATDTTYTTTIATDTTDVAADTTDAATDTTDTTTIATDTTDAATGTMDAATDAATGTTDAATDTTTSTTDAATDTTTSAANAATDTTTSTTDAITDTTTSTTDTTTSSTDATITTDTNLSTTDTTTDVAGPTSTTGNTTVELTSPVSPLISTSIGPISTANGTLASTTMTTENSSTQTSSSSTSPSTLSSTITSPTTVKQSSTVGFIIGLCLGIAFLIAFLLLLLYCCLIAEKEEEEREGSDQAIYTLSQRNFVQRWRLRLIPAAVLRKPPTVTSSSFPTTSTPYKTMDDGSTSTQAYRRKDTSIHY